MEEMRRPRRPRVFLFWYPYSGHESGSYDPGYPSCGHDSGSYDSGYPSCDYDSCSDDSGYPSCDYDSCSDDSGKLSIPAGGIKATASMELSHLRGQRGRYASWGEQRQRQTPSLRKGVSVAEAAKCPLPLLRHDQQVSRALRLHHHQMLCRKHPIPRCWNVVFKWLKGRSLCLQPG